MMTLLFACVALVVAVLTVGFAVGVHRTTRDWTDEDLLSFEDDDDYHSHV